MKQILTLALTISSFLAIAQSDRWQQEADYVMEINMDVKTHQFTGTQTLKYTNNSPDHLDRVFYHLFLQELMIVKARERGSLFHSLSDTQRYKVNTG